jgi:DUF4097 and DUF4098 domain-containing protein YvlB
MLMAIAAGLLLAVPQSQESDTTVAVERGTRLELSRLGGDVTVATWDRNAVRVRAEHGSTERVDVRITGGVATLSARGRRGRTVGMVDYILTVPVWMDLNFSGTYGDVLIEGTQARVTVETVDGDVTVTGGRGVVALQSISGDLDVSGASGDINLSATDGDVRARDLEGRVVAESVDGDIVLSGVRSSDVTATSVDGDIEYGGTLRDDGRYRFVTHDGDLVLLVPERVNATVSVATFSGSFEAAFPVTLSGTGRGKRFTFTLGSGSARIELESFDGSIQLLRR